MSDGRVESAAAAEPRSSFWRWWKSLEEDRGGRAELRRCASPAEVAFTAPYHRLLHWLGSRLGDQDARRVAVVAQVLAHVEAEPGEGVTVARRMGGSKADGQSAVVNDVRFRQLLRTVDADELARELVRVIRKLDRTAPVEQLARDVMVWDERTRARWARDYYEAAPPPKKKP